MTALGKACEFNPPGDWGRIQTLDVHAAGEPLRVIMSGIPEPPGDTMLAKRSWMQRHSEEMRRVLMWEPRGHADMYGCLPTEAVTEDGHLGVLFLHNEGYSTMCGHGIVGLVTVCLDTGLLDLSGDRPVVRIDTPAGRVTASAIREKGRVARVAFDNVPSFLLKRDHVAQVEGLGSSGRQPVTCDIGYGGAFYAYVDARTVGLELEPSRFAQIVDLGRRVKQAVIRNCEIVHPEGDPDLGFLYGTIFYQPAENGVHSRNVCVFADGELDRSPTGTGVSGRAACLVARDELALGESVVIQSLIGTSFEVCATKAVDVGGLKGIVPRVTGSAFLTGRHEFFVDPEDPLKHGFFLR
ncbi:MAG: proline racemase family protein [Planctomycetota bacterium]|nr:proline racemase family protein [Planctomycetota bacterium]